jgi:hypothetical protein
MKFPDKVKIDDDGFFYGSFKNSDEMKPFVGIGRKEFDYEIAKRYNTHAHLVEALESVVRHGLIEKDGYVMVLNEIHNALNKAKS